MSLLEYINKNVLVNETIKNFNPIWKGFINLTNLKVDRRMETLLSLGPDFQIHKKPEEKDLVETIANINRNIYRTMGIQNPDKLFYEMYNIHQKELEKLTAKESDTYMEQKTVLGAINITKNFFKTHDDVCLVQADKGKATVLIYRQEYEEKMEKFMLEKTNNGTYKKIKQPDAKLKVIKAAFHHLKSNLTKLYNEAPKEDKPFPQKLYTRLVKQNDVNAPYLHGTIKIHKEDKNIRPICASHIWYAHTIQQIIKHTVEEIIKGKLCKQNITDTNTLCKNIHKIEQKQGYCFTKMDICDMYGSTNKIDMTTVLYSIIDNDGFKEKCKIPTILLKSMIHFSTDTANIVSYKNNLYALCSGLPQGACDSGMYATIFVDYILQAKEEELFQRNQVIWWGKYMDDFILYMNEEKIERFKKTFETYTGYKTDWEHETTNKEGNSTISVLDISIIRTKNRIMTKMYQKPMASNRMIHNWSVTVNHYKKQTIQDMINKIMVRTNNNYIREDINNLKEKLLNNAYEWKEIQRLMELTISKECESLINKDKETMHHLCINEEEANTRLHILLSIIGKSHKYIQGKIKEKERNINKLEKIRNRNNDNNNNNKNEDKNLKKIDKKGKQIVRCSTTAYTYKGRNIHNLLKAIHNTLKIPPPIFKREINQLYNIIKAKTPQSVHRLFIQQHLKHLYPPIKTAKIRCNNCKTNFFISSRNDMETELKKTIHNQHSEIHKHIINTGHKINREIKYVKEIAGIAQEQQKHILTLLQSRKDKYNTEMKTSTPKYIKYLLELLNL